jgi:glutamyl-tRNA synthetase
MVVKSRFAPSPTGLMHMGNARTALFNALYAKGHQGVFLIRIEDTDEARSEDQYTDALLEDCLWLNIHWQEGPRCDQGHGPYYQNQRQEIYEHYYQQLMDKGLAYPCFCTEQELAVHRKLQVAQGLPPRYAGTCRHLTSEQIEKKKERGLKAALRFAVPKGIKIRFEDLIFGMKDFMSDDLGDFIIQKQTGGASFMFANAIDDALMGVTHALRGEDHLTNTPRQILLLEQLGLKGPRYGHFPIILGQDGKPLSKRNGSQSIQALREQGFLPLAILNYMARLGHYYDTPTLLSYQELAQQFQLEHIGRNPARFDYQQLLFWQKEALKALPEDDYLVWFKSGLQTDWSADKWAQFAALMRDNVVLPNEVKEWADQLGQTSFNWDDESLQLLAGTPKAYWAIAQAVLQQSGAYYQAVINELKTQLDLKGKALFMPLRLALTGKMHGPELAKVLQFLGSEEAIRRLQQQE